MSVVADGASRHPTQQRMHALPTGAFDLEGGHAAGAALGVEARRVRSVGAGEGYLPSSTTVAFLMESKFGNSAFR